jgi:hypothetical protein
MQGNAPQFERLGYCAPAQAALRARLLATSGGVLDSVADVRRLIHGFDYFHLSEDDTQRRSLSDALLDGSVTCLEAALLAADLCAVLGVPGRLMAMNRFNPKTESYLGHAAFIYSERATRFGAIAVSRHASQADREATFGDEEEVALSYAYGYLALGLIPLSLGLSDLAEVGAGLDWRNVAADLQQLHGRLLASQDCVVELAELG